MMTIAEKQHALLADFALLPDWADRYRYIIELGEKMPPMPEALKTPANRISGCASRTFFFVDRTGGILTVYADSNAAIPLGLAALLHHLYSGHTLAEAAETPLFFPEKSGLMENLTGNRRVGFGEMIEKLLS